MKKRIKDFGKFRNEFSKIDENKIGDWVKDKWKSISSKFGKDAWMAYSIEISKDSNSGVEYFPAGTIPKSMLSDQGNYDVDPDELKYGEDEINDATMEIPPESVEDILKEELGHSDRSIREVDAKLMMDRIEKTYHYRQETGELSSVFIWGAPGIGKTEILEQLAKKLDVDLLVLHLSQVDPTDFRGVPMVKKIDGRDRTVQVLPEFFPTSNGSNNKGGILFFDELNASDRIVLRAALPLCLDGKIQGYTLPEKWIIVAAGNRMEDVNFGDVEELNAPLADRFRHLNYIPTIESWSDWAMPKKYIDPRLIAFFQMDENKEYFHKMKEDDGEDPNMNWSSPRGWSKASAFSYFESKGKFNLPMKELQGLYQEFVGTESANKFIKYLELIKIISEKEIQDLYEKGENPKTDINKLRLDRKNAVLTAIGYYKKGNKKSFTGKNYQNLIDWAFDNISNPEEKTLFFSAIKRAHTIDGKSYLEDESPWREIRDSLTERWYDEMGEILDDE